jgi:hypothetical protein
MFFRLANPEIARIGGYISALGAALVALSYTYKPLLENLTSIRLSFLEAPFFRYAFFAILLLGVIVVLVWFVFWVLEHVFVRTPRRIEQILKALDDLALKQCSEADLKEISHLARQEFGTMAATFERNCWLAEIDKSAYWKVATKKGRIVGFMASFA